MPEPVHNNPVSPQPPEQPPAPPEPREPSAGVEQVAKIIPFRRKPEDTTAAVEQLPDQKALEEVLGVAQELDPENAKMYSDLIFQKGDILKTFEKRGQEMRADPAADDQQKVNGYEFEIAALSGRFYKSKAEGERRGIWQKIENLRREQAEIIAKNKDVVQPQLSEFAKAIGVEDNLSDAAPLAGIQEKLTSVWNWNQKERDEFINKLEEMGLEKEQTDKLGKFVRHEKVRSLGKKGLIGAGLAAVIMVVFGWMAIKRARGSLRPTAQAA